MSHYHPYSSKWNPVKHRVFPNLTHAMRGIILTSYELTKTFLEHAATSTGLQVLVYIINRVYQIGRKAVDDFKVTMRILFDRHLGQWNYRAVPLFPAIG